MKCISLGLDCGADESYRLEGRIGTLLLHSCLGHPLQQLNMLEANTDSNKIQMQTDGNTYMQIQEGKNSKVKLGRYFTSLSRTPTAAAIHLC